MVPCPQCGGSQIIHGQRCQSCHEGFVGEPTSTPASDCQTNGLVGRKVRFKRPLQGRIYNGIITHELLGGCQPHYVCNFGPREFLELCVRSLEDGFLEVTASGNRIEILPEETPA